MKNLLGVLTLLLSLCFTGCVFNPDQLAFKSDSAIVASTFEQVREFYTSSSSDCLDEIVAIRTDTLKFNTDKTVEYTRTYNKQALTNPNLTNCTEKGTYIVNKDKKQLEIDGLSDTNFNRRFDYKWNDQDQLELYTGFMDETLFLRLTKID